MRDYKRLDTAELYQFLRSKSGQKLEVHVGECGNKSSFQNLNFDGDGFGGASVVSGNPFVYEHGEGFIALLAEGDEIQVKTYNGFARDLDHIRFGVSETDLLDVNTEEVEDEFEDRESEIQIDSEARGGMASLAELANLKFGRTGE